MIIASLLARAINGSAPLGPTLVSGFALVLAHRLLAFLSLKWHWIGNLVKGREDTLIESGRVDEEAMKKHNFTKRDLMEDLRLEGVRGPE